MQMRRDGGAERHQNYCTRSSLVPQALYWEKIEPGTHPMKFAHVVHSPAFLGCTFYASNTTFNICRKGMYLFSPQWSLTRLCRTWLTSFGTYRHKVWSSKVPDDSSTGADPHVTNEWEKPPGQEGKRITNYRPGRTTQEQAPVSDHSLFTHVMRGRGVHTMQ